jgi:iron complex transport system ATP-binding protein
MMESFGEAMEPALVDLKNVRVIRGDNVALDDFSLRINAGEHVAILGPNGCGKSTLIKTITRECYPVIREDSSMTILGQSRWNIFELRSVLGIVSNDLMQDVTGETSGREVVLSGFFSSTRIFDHQTVEPSQRKRADAVLERIGVPHLADRPVAEKPSEYWLRGRSSTIHRRSYLTNRATAWTCSRSMACGRPCASLRNPGSASFS